MADLPTPALSEMQKRPIFPSDAVRQRKGGLRCNVGALSLGPSRGGGTCHSSPWSAAFVSGSSPSFKCPLCIGSSLPWLLPSFLTTTSKFPPQASVPSGLCGCSGSSQDVFTPYCTHSLGDSHSHGSHPRCVHCPPPPSQSTGQTTPLCPMTPCCIF